MITGEQIQRWQPGAEYRDRKGFVYICAGVLPGVGVLFSCVNKGSLAARYPSGAYLIGNQPHEYDIAPEREAA